MIWSQLRHAILGSPLPTTEEAGKRLDSVRALAALSPDALASVAYANQEIYLSLIVAGAAGLGQAWTIAVVITGLLAALTVSYSQIIRAYPAGGGAYTVARENLGEILGLVAAAGLLIAYILNAAVSLTAGVEALSSAFPVFWSYRTPLSLVLLLFITLVNLRGLQEAGTVMAVPVYLFVVTYLVLIGYGIVIGATQGPGTPQRLPAGALQSVTLVLLLRTFASGATALTGIEAISNAVPIFKSPAPRHARQTMMAMALLMGILFLGTIGLIQYLAVTPGPDETILSALSRRLLGGGALYYVVQAITLGVLVVAANTSFAGFPRVVSVMARDGYTPRQLRIVGDRLVYSNGILLLSALSGLLIIAFGGDSHSLIPLFAVGSFLAFTLSQAGMVVHWAHERTRRWRTSAAINGLGALATGSALLIIGASRFTQGAWIVLILLPLFVILFRRTRAHYDAIAAELTLAGEPVSLDVCPLHSVVMPVAGVHRGVINALCYARSISDDVTAVYVEVEPESGAGILKRWHDHGLDALAPLVILPSPYRSFLGPFLAYLDRLDTETGDAQAASVIIPEFVPTKWWHNLLHNQTALMLRLALLYRRRYLGKVRAIIDIPYQLQK